MNQYRLNITIVSFLAVLGVLICTIEHEIYIIHGINGYKGLRYLLLSFNMLVTLLLIVSIVFSYLIWMQWERLIGHRLVIDSMSKDLK